MDPVSWAAHRPLATRTDTKGAGDLIREGLLRVGKCC